ncbi:MAG: hypothetical protein ACRC6V_01970 [Bacteroidales bacterium]|jgi:2-hydroxy-3-keto-5-methylthiopentenyl-1-phosphate phosphatase
MSQYTEKEYFNNLVRLFEQQISIREAIKGETDRAKENELDFKVIKKVAKFYADNNFEEVSGEFALIKEAYENLAD